MAIKRNANKEIAFLVPNQERRKKGQELEEEENLGRLDAFFFGISGLSWLLEVVEKDRRIHVFVWFYFKEIVFTGLLFKLKGAVQLLGKISFLINSN